MRQSTSFNGRILDVIKVSTEPFLRDDMGQERRKKKERGGESSKPSARDARINRRRQRDIETQMIDTTDANAKAAEAEDDVVQEKEQSREEPPDYLFVILTNFNVALLCFSKRDQKIEVVSRGNISEKVLHD